ncbi:MAG: hypothetical protein ACWGO1_09110 [Anaerolineales bacterium]
MDIGLYRRLLEAYVQEAYDNSDGSPAGMAEYMRSINVSGRFVRHRVEKQAARKEALKAFEEHRHWPLEIIFSHLGVEIKR